MIDFGPHDLSAENVTLGYGGAPVIEGLSLQIRPGDVTSVVGANGCGKSTLLRGLGRLLRPSAGEIILDGKAIASIPSKEVARTLGLLPQAPLAPEGITVADLVSRGRHPHQGAFGRWTDRDGDAVAAALEATGITDLADRSVDELSGGQRQRVWIAMVLAQETGILLLDEPTTFLDVAHQVDILELLRKLNRDRKTTIVMVLHDLNMAARYSDHLVAMRDGKVVSQGTPHQVVTEATVRDVFALESKVIPDPVFQTPMVVPIRRVGARGTRGRSSN